MSKTPINSAMPVENSPRIVSAFDRDALWFSPAGAPVPAHLSARFDIADAMKLPIEDKLVCLVEAPVESLAAGLKHIRARIGDEAYLIVLFPGAELPEKAARALDFGADDVAASEDMPGLKLAIVRGDRVLLRLRREAALGRGLKIERDFLQACIDNIPTPIFFKNNRGIYVGCNRAFESYLGLPAGEIIGSSVFDVSPRQCAEIYAEADAKLLAAGGEQSYESNVRYADGSLRDVAFRKAVITDEHGEARGLAGAMLDITDRKRLESELAHAASRDPLTNIFNRRHFFKHVEGLAGSATANWPATLAVIDIDHFKAVNDRFGHAAGDAVLCAVASLLETRLGNGVVARAGGEEFVAYLPGVTFEAAPELIEEIRRDIATLVVEDGASRISVTASIGLAEHWPARETLWECMRPADAALYEAKHTGRNRMAFAA